MTVRVLIVDDSAFMRNLLKRQIIEVGADVVGEAENGQDAVVKYEALKPNIVFMDIMMPGVNGLDALKQIITKDSNAKIVMCTSVGQEKVIGESVEAGASDFIVKPFTKEDVAAIIKKYQ